MIVATRRRNLLALLMILLAFWAWRSGRIAVDIPDQWNPWSPLDVRAPLDRWTRMKLMRIDHDDVACKTALATAMMRYQDIPDRATGDGCGFDNAIRISETTAKVASAFALSCRSAVALAMWETHGLQPSAERWFGSRVARIEHFGSYSCRNIYGRDSGPRSRHATADAFDVAGFMLANGKRVRVLGDWKGGSREAQFLHDIHQSACRYFGSVLGPDYNAAHRDHFHLDRGGYRVCR
ncbi:MAG: extensin family protein [Dokdonella sp.]